MDKFLYAAHLNNSVKRHSDSVEHLHSCGYKASFSKLQFVQDKVTFLGHVISKDGRSLSPKRIAAVQNIPKKLL